MAIKVQVVFDCADPAKLSAFWALALDYEQPPPPDGFDSWEDWVKAQGWPESEWNSASAVEDPAGIGPRIYFQRVPEPKSVKNRMHIDINVSGGRKVPFEERRGRIDTKAGQLEAAGASIFRIFDRPEREPDHYFIVMQDPEGNEFCIQ